MNKDIFMGQWVEMKGKIKQQWSRLTDDDILQIDGQYDELVGKLQKHYGYEKANAEREIHDFIKRNGD